jgi:hypothetical protein
MSKIEKKMNSSNILKDFQWNENSIIINLDDDDE